MVVLASFPQPTEGVRLEQRDTCAHLNDRNLGKGTLYIAESRLYWIGCSGGGFSLEYPHISLHAISRDLNAFPQECLFLMLDTAIEDSPDNEYNEEDDDQGTTELRFVPEDKGMLDAMFHAMSVCQALHPDPEDSLSDEDFYEDADESIEYDETNIQFSKLSIVENRGVFAYAEDNMAYKEEGRVGGRVEDREEDTAAVDTAVGRVAVCSEAAGIWADKAVEDMEEGRVEDAEAGTVEGTAVGNTRRFYGCRWSYSSSNRQEDISDDRFPAAEDGRRFDDAEN